MRNTIAHWMIVGFIATAFCGCQGGIGMPRWDWWRTADNAEPAATSSLAGSPYNSGIPSATASYPGSSTKGSSSLPSSGPGNSALSKTGSPYPGPNSYGGYPGNPYGTPGNVAPSQPGLGSSGYPGGSTRDMSAYPGAGSSPYPITAQGPSQPSRSNTYPNSYPNTNTYPDTQSSTTQGSGSRYPSASQDRYPETPVSYPNEHPLAKTSGSQFSPQTGPYGGAYGNNSAAGSSGIEVNTPPVGSNASKTGGYQGMEIIAPDRSGLSSGATTGLAAPNNTTPGYSPPANPPANTGTLGPRYADVPGSNLEAPTTPTLPPKQNAYVPGASTYQPGNTGYNPPNVPSYSVPGYQSPAGTNPTQTSPASPSSYRPGSTSTYSPTSSGPVNTPTTPVPTTSPARASYLGEPSVGTGTGTPPSANQAPAPGIPPAQSYPPPATYPSTGY